MKEPARRAYKAALREHFKVKVEGAPGAAAADRHPPTENQTVVRARSIVSAVVPMQSKPLDEISRMCVLFVLRVYDVVRIYYLRACSYVPTTATCGTYYGNN